MTLDGGFARFDENLTQTYKTANTPDVSDLHYGYIHFKYSTLYEMAI